MIKGPRKNVKIIWTSSVQKKVWTKTIFRPCYFIITANCLVCCHSRVVASWNQPAVNQKSESRTSARWPLKRRPQRASSSATFSELSFWNQKAETISPNNHSIERRDCSIEFGFPFFLNSSYFQINFIFVYFLSND